MNEPESLKINWEDIFRARKTISGIARRTPLIFSDALSEWAQASVYLKMETLQPTGSFKIRGALNALLSLTEEQKERGVIAFSTGNHGRAVAFVARSLGIKAVVCLSERVPEYRVEAMKKLGAEVEQRGVSQDEAYEYALFLQRERGLTMIGPFDDPAVIAGQGTVGLEIMEQLPAVDAILVPISGGGLASGVALAVKTLSPRTRVVGVSMDCAPAMYHSLKAGKPVEIEEKDSIADALLGGIGLDNRYTFSMIRDLIDRFVLVSEEEIAEAMLFCIEEQKVVVEGAGAVGVSVLLSGKEKDLGKNIVVVASGGNVDVSLLLEMAKRRASANNDTLED